jgi:Cu(I)/Ag(I) efflux system membrane protein CusA/SilA
LVNLLIIYFGFRSFSLSAIVFTSVPIAASGGLLLLWLGGFNTSVAVWVGFIALFGIAVDDGVVMMTFLRQAMKKNSPQNYQELKEVIKEAGKRRIRPLVMTTTTTVIALLPVMWSTGQGSEVMRPMAIPTLGGMAIALISLFVVPVIFSYVEEKKLKNKGELL